MLSKCKVTISGVLKQIPLPDILQLLSTSKRTGYLKVVSTFDTAYILFKDGAIDHAYFENNPHEPKEVIFMLMSFSSGKFEFYKCDGKYMKFKNTINIAIPFLLMQAAQYEDEMSVDIEMDFD